MQELNEIFSSDYNLDSILCLHAHTWKRPSRFNYLDRPRTQNGLVYAVDSPALYRLQDGHTIRVEVGEAVLLPKGSYYEVTFPGETGIPVHPVVLNFRLTDPSGREIPLSCGIVRLGRGTCNLTPLFTTAAQLYKNGPTAALKAKVYEIFSNIFPMHSMDDCCLSYIRSHFTEQFNVKALAERCSLSESAYRKRFRQLTGLSPIKYINRLKIEKACQMLQISDISTASISEFLNFYSLPYFYKIFRDVTGMTPIQYRNSDGK